MYSRTAGATCTADAGNLLLVLGAGDLRERAIWLHVVRSVRRDDRRVAEK